MVFSSTPNLSGYNGGLQSKISLLKNSCNSLISNEKGQ